MLETARACRARFYQASSSEIFGAQAAPQNEMTPMQPRSPYGAAKAFAHHMTQVYRDSYGMHASCGILFNHESPMRGEEFVTRKITLAVARIWHSRQTRLLLGNLDAMRDWGHARDYVKAMHLMVRHPEPGDYVVATGARCSVRAFLGMAFGSVGLNWQDYVVMDPAMLRPAEVPHLCGDASLARLVLGWTPSTPLEQLVREMVEADVARVRDSKC
jgi:GDPmannose 4,6-dehydratase